MARSLPVALALCGLLAAARAAAQAPAAPASPQLLSAWFDLTVNDQRKGQTLLQLGDGDVWAPVDDLGRAGLAVDGGVRRSAGERTLVSLRSLAPAIQYVLDEERLELRITAAPGALGGSTLDLNPHPRPAALSRHEVPSAFLNLGARAEDRERASGSAELGITVGPRALLTGAGWDREHGFQRGLTVARWDDADALIRYTAGEFFVPSPDPLGGSALLAGASAGRELSLDPYLLRDPYPRTALFVSTPSTLEVWVGDTLVRRTEVAPGTLDIENLPLEAGPSEVRTVLRDAFGREQSASTNFLMGSDLLAPGLVDWGGAAGWMRGTNLDGRVRYGDAVATVRCRRGMSRLLTLGGRAEVGPSLVNAGGTAGLATGAGNIEAGAAASRAASAGGAGYLGWKAQLGRRVSAAAQLRAMSARYATVSLDRLADRSLLRAVVGISISPTPRVSLLGELSAFRDRDAGQGWRGTLRTVLGVGRAQQVGASLSAASWSGRQVAWEAMVTWSVQLPRSHSLQLGAGADDGSGSGWASVTRGLGTGPGIGYRVEAGAGPGAVASVDVQGQSRFGWAAVRERWVDPWTARRSQSGELEVATRLTLIDGGVYASRPADGGYALVVLDGAPGVHVTLDGQEVGRTDRNGRLLVPGLLPYYGNRIAIRDPDVPLGYRVDEVSRHVAPRFQGGTVERFEVGPPRVATGKVLLSTGEDQDEEVPAWGEIAVEQPSGPVVSPIGDDGMFWLEGLPPGRQEALVRWRGRSCGVTLEIPASAGVAQLGVLRCAPGPEAEDAPAPGSP